MTSSAVRWTWCAMWVLGGALSGCVTEQVNHCLDAPNMVGCPELCLEDPTWEHCPLVDPSQFVEDAGACGTCTVSYPFCDAATTACVECTAANGCECWRDEPCGAGAPVCESGECKACGSDLDCVRFASDGRTNCHGSTGSCEACEEDCGASVDTKVCEPVSGTCVECTVDSEVTACPPEPGEDVGPACDPVAFTCTGALRGSLGPCGACISDSECMHPDGSGQLRCVPMDFNGSPHGTYCLLDILDHRTAVGDPFAQCPLQFRSTISGKTSVGDVLSDYCSVRQSQTTCEALQEFGAGCSPVSPCSMPGSFCSSADAVGQCTYVCSSDVDCPGDINGDVSAGSCIFGTPSSCDPS